MRLISASYLPNASLKNIGIIQKDDVFAYESYLKVRPRAYIHNDGGLVRFFKMETISIAKISKIIKDLPLGSALQIYRYHEIKGEVYYMSIRKDIDYGKAFQKHIFDRFTMNPERRAIVNIYEETNKAYDSISSAIEGSGIEEIEYTESLLPKILLECDIKGQNIGLSSIRSNMSYLKVGIERYATIGSINNMSVIPKARGCLNEHRFLQRMLIIIPSQDRLSKLQEVTISNGRMIKALSNDAAQKRTVHVDTVSFDQSIEGIMEIRGKICYADVSFFLFNKTTEDLEEAFKRFYGTMEKNNISMYCHTNTSRAAYTTFFPGNEAYGERYSLLFEYFMNILMQNVLEL